MSAWMQEPAHILESAVQMMLDQIEAEEEQAKEAKRRGR